MDSDPRNGEPSGPEPTPIPESAGPGGSRGGPTEPGERPVFQHPQWMVGVVLIFAVVAIVAGLRNPVWWLIGSPCILVLAVWLYVKFRA